MWFGVLGPVVARNGNAVIGVPGGRQRVLLAALLMRAGQVLPTDALAEAVWDGSPPPEAVTTLRSHVSRLRRALGPVAGSRVLTRYPGYLIEASEQEVDLLRFDSLTRDGGAEARAGHWGRTWELLAEGLGLWRGEPLADVPSEVLRRDQLPRLERLRLQALEWRADAGLHLGRHEELVGELQSLAAAEPLQERFHAQLMLALMRCGRQAEALDAYQSAREILAGQLGAEPGTGLRELHQRILTGDPALEVPESATRAAERLAVAALPELPRPVPHRAWSAQAASLVPEGDVFPAIGDAAIAARSGELLALAVPHPASVDLPDVMRGLPRRPARVFEGRGDALGVLEAALAARGGVVVAQAVYGLGGVGKSELALQYADTRQREYRLVWWITASDAGQLEAGLAGLAGRLCPPAATAGTTAKAAGWAIGWLQAHDGWLLILDNVEDTAYVEPLLGQVGAGHVVITTRRDVDWTRLADPVLLDVLDPAAAVQLLLRRIGGHEADDKETAGQIAADLGFLPLALDQAAAYIVAQRITLAAYLDNLHRVPARITPSGPVRSGPSPGCGTSTSPRSATGTRRLPGCLAYWPGMRPMRSRGACSAVVRRGRRSMRRWACWPPTA